MADKSRRSKKPEKAPEKPKVKLTEGSKKARLTAARLAAAQVMYQMWLNGEDAKSATRDYMQNRAGFEIDGDTLVPADGELLEKIVSGAEKHHKDIDAIITKNLDKKSSSVEPLLRAILTAGIYELLQHTEIDAGIIIADYLNVTHSFYDGGEGKLVNAVLDKVAKAVR